MLLDQNTCDFAETDSIESIQVTIKSLLLFKRLMNFFFRQIFRI
jgi:hypothetical protein